MKMKQEIKDQLAIERTRLAEERTDLAYIRTGFSLLLGGIFFIGYFLPGTIFMYVGYTTIVISLVFILYGFYHHKKSMAFLNEMLNVPRRGVFKAKWVGEQIIGAGNGEKEKKYEKG
jgi:putative membrane protein